ncbi:MAG: ATP-binding protein, partial [Acidobacteriota bacterium]
KTAFFSNVSHEFRTPLTLMLGPIEDHARDSAGDPSQEWLGPVLRNGRRLQKLVNSLLEFSRIEAGRVQASFEPTDLAQFTEDLASLFRSSIEKAGLRLLIDAPPLPEPVYVDRDMWEKVVLNLLSNAFKFTFDGEITVSLGIDGDRVRLTVRDTGSGIPAAELPRIFERFHRVESAKGRTYEGTGIGLALTAELVRMHGGHVAVESIEGRGTTFTVAIPRGTAHLPGDRIRSGPMRAPASQSGHAFVEEASRWLPSETHGAVTGLADVAEASPARAGARVLIADDNADMRDYLRRLLGTRWQVTVCSNGREALAALAGDLPDLLVTDVMMPEIDGFGLLAAVRGNERTRELPVVMLSARAGEDSRVEGLEAGADDYVVKPFSARELVARVETQLLRAEMRAIEQANRQRMADLFRQAPAAIAVLSGPAHVFELANPVYLELVGGRAVVGKAIREALPELRDQEVLEIMSRVFSSGEAHEGRSLRVMLVRREGGPPEETFFDFVYQPMRGADGSVESIAVIAFEVTNLEKARRTAEAASRAKDEFLANLSHELRTPLNAVLGWTRMLLDGAVSEHSSRRALESIHRNAQMQQQLIADILDVSNIIQGRLRLELRTVRVGAVLQAALDSVQPALLAKEIALTVSGDQEAQLSADPARLQQIIWNLLTNAAKFTPQGGAIAVRVEPGPGRIRIVVRDNGVGIEPDALPHVFQRFWQADASPTRTHTGLGLGLAIVRHLV